MKETLRRDVALNRGDRRLEDVVGRMPAGFANHVGGTLPIGVASDGSVRGMELDLACSGGGSYKLQLHLTDLPANRLGQEDRLVRRAA